MDSVMVCSKEFAEWLLEQKEQGDSSEIVWLDLILKYCNFGYDELIAEEMKKANKLYYRICLNNDYFEAVPSYELVEMKAGDPADHTHIRSMKRFCDGYSVLTTGAAFPGKQQFPISSSNWDVQYLIDECVHLGEEMIRIFKNDSEKSARLNDNVLKSYEGNEEVVWEDQYSYHEFIRANEYRFVDNQFPFCVGPSCPDRILSMNTYHNIIRRASLDCAEICRKMNLNEHYQEIFVVLLARTILCSIDTDKKPYRGIHSMIDRACEVYREYIEEVPEGTDLEGYCRKIRAFLNTSVKVIMGTMDKKAEEARICIRDTALKHKDTSLNDYISPQEMFSQCEPPYVIDSGEEVIIDIDDIFDEDQELFNCWFSDNSDEIP